MVVVVGGRGGGGGGGGGGGLPIEKGEQLQISLLLNTWETDLHKSIDFLL